jgi:NADH-quinone oxidoreductase subunit K
MNTLMHGAATGVPHSSYIGLSVLLFAIGLFGVARRRNPLMLLLAVELLLNSANIALLGFSRYWNNSDGQIFALVVMVVAVFHQRRALDVDEMTELRG